MNTIKKNGILLITMLLYVSTFLAQNSITGTINDQTGAPLPGVNVILDGTKIGAVTDFDGNFSLKFSNGKVTAYFSESNLPDSNASRLDWHRAETSRLTSLQSACPHLAFLSL